VNCAFRSRDRSGVYTVLNEQRIVNECSTAHAYCDTPLIYSAFLNAVSNEKSADFVVKFVNTCLGGVTFCGSPLALGDERVELRVEFGIK
jgi:hypothetical protein